MRRPESEIDELFGGLEWTSEQQAELRRLAGVLDSCKREINRIIGMPSYLICTDDLDHEFIEEMSKPGHATYQSDADIPPGMPILPEGWSQDVESGMITDAEGNKQGIPLGWRRSISEDDPNHPGLAYRRFSADLESLLNRHSMENGSDTPDFILAEMLTGFLRAFNAAIKARDAWYGGSHRQLKSQLETEGAHTAAANDMIDRLQREMK